MKRRNFLSSLAGITAGISAGIPAVFAEASADTGIQIAQPFNGAVLHRRLKEPVVGVVEDGSGKPVALKIKVSGEAPSDAAVTINGIATHRNGKTFEAEIELRQEMNDIVVQAKSPSNETKEARVKVLWLKNSEPRYRFTIDDTIFCLREIHRNNYKSIFDDYLLGNLRKMHQKYGTKVALNIFYETSGDEQRLNVEREPFNLSMFSDKYKSEWRDNADWLRLLFHAKREFPNEPYKDASAETLIADFVQIEKEIKRFAGEETYLPATVIHWGTIRPETYKPLAAHGVTFLSGYFTKRADGNYQVCYQMDNFRSDYLNRNDFLLDEDSGIVFSKMDMVINTVPLANVVPILEKAVSDPNTAEFLDLMTHEQYFWSFYKNYLPDHWERLDRAFAFAAERGYKPVFLNDLLVKG
ncbi:MAG: hypothetical protein FWE67_03625 [Planctomycetaceae bacterium]|nr:hypothetical protein [Planctomycetaceae bacterium]